MIYIFKRACYSSLRIAGRRPGGTDGSNPAILGIKNPAQVRVHANQCLCCLHCFLFITRKVGAKVSCDFREIFKIFFLKMSAQRALPQSKEALLKSYTTRLKDDVKSMLENFEGT